MNSKKYKVLEDLINIRSPSNDEKTMCNYITSGEYTNFKLLGKIINSVMYKLDIGADKTILIDVHIDEIHSRIVSITKDGFLIVKVIGTYPKYLTGRPVKIMSTKQDSDINGVFLADIPHLKGLREKYKDPFNEEILYVDIGVNSMEKAKQLVEIGDSVLVDYNFNYMRDDMLIGRGLDNKLGVYTLLHLLGHYDKNPFASKYNIILNFSGKEEIGKASFLHHIDTDIDSIIVLDTDYATDVPFVNDTNYGLISLGSGPVITRGPEDSGLYRDMISISNHSKIPIQVHYPLSGGSNLSDLSKYNTKSQFIGIPIRNIHSPVETCNLLDVDNTIKLLKKFIET